MRHVRWFLQARRLYEPPIIAIEAENTDVAKEEMKRGLAEPFTPAVTKGAEY
jgi:hypothetical protein